MQKLFYFSGRLRLCVVVLAALASGSARLGLRVRLRHFRYRDELDVSESSGWDGFRRLRFPRPKSELEWHIYGARFAQ